jgi:hypothetical protein
LPPHTTKLFAAVLQDKSVCGEPGSGHLSLHTTLPSIVSIATLDEASISQVSSDICLSPHMTTLSAAVPYDEPICKALSNGRSSLHTAPPSIISITGLHKEAINQTLSNLGLSSHTTTLSAAVLHDESIHEAPSNFHQSPCTILLSVLNLHDESNSQALSNLTQWDGDTSLIVTIPHPFIPTIASQEKSAPPTHLRLTKSSTAQNL